MPNGILRIIIPIGEKIRGCAKHILFFICKKFSYFIPFKICSVPSIDCVGLLLVNINNTNNYVPIIQSRGEAANSDHYFFYKKGVKSLYIYTLGTYKEYHNIYDRAEIIPMPAYNGIYNLVKDFVTDF